MRKIAKYLFLCIFSILISSSAFAGEKQPFIYMNKSVGPAELGMNYLKGIKLLKLQPVKTEIDREYEGQTVYCSYFGTKDNSNNYSFEVYSDAKRNIIIFVINSPMFQTPEGIKVGSSEADLTKSYSKMLKKSKKGKIYTKYSTGGKKGTDFYVKSGVVTQIIIRDYNL